MIGRLARWWQEHTGIQCRDCGLDTRDARDAAAIWEEDQQVILAAREMVADGKASARLAAAIAARDAKEAARRLLR